MASKKDFIESKHAYLSRAAQQGLFSLPKRREFLIKHVGNSPKKILDVGCAGGYISLLLMKMGHDVTGIELNKKMAEEARMRGVNVVEHDLEEPIPLESNSVDIVHACEIIEHLFDTESFLKEINRILKPNGIVIISTPNLNSFINRFRVFIGSSLPMWGGFPNDRHGSHVRVFNKKKIFELLNMTGFEPQVTTGINQAKYLKVFNNLPTFSEMILIKAIKSERQ